MSVQQPVDRRLQRRTTSDTVADELREAIVRGDFADGTELNQVDLAREFGVSRVPIREALRQLRAEGLITSEPHMRAAVVGHTLERVVEILELRMLLRDRFCSNAAPPGCTGDYRGAARDERDDERAPRRMTSGWSSTPSSTTGCTATPVPRSHRIWCIS